MDNLGRLASHRRPGDVLAAVEIVLRDLGLTHLYRSGSHTVGLLSVADGVTAWCDGRVVKWRYMGGETTWTAADPEGAARQLAKLAGAGS